MHQLRRELGIPGAVLLGLGSILGTGVFVSIALGASVAGGNVLLAILLASLLAMCNGLSSAQLAAKHPVSGGTYEYGYREIAAPFGFTAGWMFLCAKSASAGAAAIGFSLYVLSLSGAETDTLARWVALGAVIALTLLVLSGLKRSNLFNMAVVSVVIASLIGFAAMCLWHAAEQGSIAWQAVGDVFRSEATDEYTGQSALAIGTATALMFVAYTGYGRVATLGEEVHHPRRTIPIAVVVTLIVSAAIYMIVAFATLSVVGAERFASIGASGTRAPLAEVALAMQRPWLGTLISIAAALAMLTVLLNLILGLSRVMLAMGRRGDMPHAVSAINAAGTTPWIATIVVGIIIGAIALLGSFKLAWSFSAFTVLVYYAITNLAALRLGGEARFAPKWVSLVGCIACLSLAFFIEWPVMLAGVGVIAVGLIWFAIAQRLRARADGKE